MVSADQFRLPLQIQFGLNYSMPSPILLPAPQSLTWGAVYRRLAVEKDIHALTQRPDEEWTEALARDADARIALKQDERVLDIGCGDARLLRRFAGIAGMSVGSVLTQEECERLAQAHEGSDIRFIAGRVEDLTLEPVFDVIILSAVLSHLPSRKAVRSALISAAKLATNDARLYVADLRETKFTPKRHHSTLRALHWVWRTSGFSVWLGFIVHLWKRRHRAGYYEVPQLPKFAASTSDFIKLADECGLTLIEQWSSVRPSGYGIPEPRNDYMFQVRD